MHVTLAADRLIAESPRRISNHAEQKHPLFEFGSNFLATYIHRDGVYGIGPRTGRISQARPNRVERAPFGWRAENAWFIAKPQGLADRNYTETGIESHDPVLTAARTVAHRPVPSAGRTL